MHSDERPDWLLRGIALIGVLGFIAAVYFDDFSPYARACRAEGGVPALSNNSCYVTTIHEIKVQ